jgi:small nuclear ribonucleoprotein (snRNP)-like protein
MVNEHSDKNRDGSVSKRGDNLRKRLHAVEHSVAETKRDVAALKDAYNVKDNASSLIASWIDKHVKIRVTTGKTYCGILKFVDKYNYGVFITDKTEYVSRECPTVFPKTNIIYISILELGDDG